MAVVPMKSISSAMAVKIMSLLMSRMLPATGSSPPPVPPCHRPRGPQPWVSYSPWTELYGAWGSATA